MSSHPRAEDIDELKAAIQEAFHEDPINLEWALEKVERLTWSVGSGPHANLLLLMWNLVCEEEEARRHWDGITRHRASLQRSLGRDVALRVAGLDYLVQQNRSSSRPRLLEVLQAHRPVRNEMSDPVTGLHAAGFLADQLPRELGRARRFKLALSLVHVEIDDFPAVTERLGPTMGTMLLREISEIVTSCVRNIDYAARVCAGEFALLLTETDRMGAYYVAERIRQRTEEFYLERRVDGRPLDLTVSAGVASFPEDADGEQDLARRATEAYHTARARGRGRVAIHYRERREYIRLAPGSKDLQITLIPEGSVSNAGGSMRNISSGGVLFESETPIALGRTVHILCRNRRESDQVLIPGRVVRIERFEAEAGERYEIGVLFDLVVEEQLEGVVEFLERFISTSDAEDEGPEPGRSDRPGAP